MFSDPDNMLEISQHLAFRNPPVGKGCKESKPLLVFIDRVFYARAIDFDFGYDRTIAATLGDVVCRLPVPFSNDQSFRSWHRLAA